MNDFLRKGVVYAILQDWFQGRPVEGWFILKLLKNKGKIIKMLDIRFDVGRGVSGLAVVVLLFLSGCSRGEHHEHHGSDSRHGHHHGGDTTAANQYMHAMSFDSLVKRFDAQGRADWQRPDEVLAKMEPLAGKTVADIGAGTGYFSFRLAERAEQVIAIDIDPRFIRYIEEKRDSLGLDNLVARKTTPNTPGLQAEEVDYVLMVNTYHHIDDRPLYMALLRKGLKPGGAFWVVDFKGGKLPVGPPARMKISAEAAQAELAEAGFDTFELDTTLLPHQYILVASKSQSSP